MSELTKAVGSWHIMVYEPDGPPTHALCTLGADGTMVTGEHPVVTPPGAPGPVFTSSGHGAWKAAGPDRAIFTFVTFGANGDGSLYGVVTFHGDATLSQDAASFTGDVTARIEDPQGAEIATFPMTIEGTRIVAGETAGSVTRPAATAVG